MSGGLDPAELLAIKDRAAAALLRQPGVTAVGLGSKEVGGVMTGEPAIKVFVKVKRAPGDVPPAQLIPADFEGVPTDVIETGEITKVVDPPGCFPVPATSERVRYRPLIGGGRVSREGSGEGGTMGCVLWDPAHHDTAYALTNFHVVDASDVAALVVGTSKVGQPTGDGSVTDCCSDLIGVYSGGGMTDDRDEALVRLDPGQQWVADIQEIGAVAGKHALTQAEALPGTYKVRKRGARTQLTGGLVSALNATTHETDNAIVINPNPNPAAAATDTVFFAYEGDSGSALVNEAREVIGLIHSRDASGHGYAFPIQHVLDHFAAVEHITVDVATAAAAGTVHTVPGAAMVATPLELQPVLGAAPRPAGRPAPPGWLPPQAVPAPAFLQRDLDRSRVGRALITLWLDHQRELLALVNGNRRVALAWHRSGASALFQTLVRMPSDPAIALPPTIDGRPLSDCLDRVQAAFERDGSERLGRDLRAARRDLPDVGGLTYPQIVAVLDGAP
jgi:hypothetical protein